MWLGAVNRDHQNALSAQQHRERTEIVATTTAPAPLAPGTGVDGYTVSYTDATWKFRGVEHTGTVPADFAAPVGTSVPIWVDRNGNPTVAPIPPGSIGVSSWLLSIFVVVATAGLVVGAWWSVRYLIDRRRSYEWDVEIARFLGSTSSH